MSAMDDVRAAERFVIGSLLRKPAVIQQVQEIDSEDFEDQRLGMIFNGIARMVLADEPVDYLTVADKLAEWGVHGIDLPDLAEWATAVPSPETAPYYAHIVRGASVDRQGIAIADRLRQNIARKVTSAIPAAITELQSIHGRTGMDEHERWLGDVLDVPEGTDAYDWVVPGLLERGDRLMLTGTEGSGKSTLLRQIAIMAGAGLHPFTGQQVSPVKVLIVDVENTEQQWRRSVRDLVLNCRQYGVEDPRRRVAVRFSRRMNIADAADIGRIHRMVDRVKPDLMVLGPLYRLTPKAIKDDDDATPILAAIDTIRDRGIAMMIEAHPGHGTLAPGKRDMRPRGSSALLGWPEFGLGLVKPERDGEPHELVPWRGDRDIRAWPRSINAKRYRHGQFWPWEPLAEYRMRYHVAAPTLALNEIEGGNQ